VATVIGYVDGFNLYHGLRDKYRRRYLWLDLAHLVRRLRPRDEILAVRYFTALVRDDPPALARQRDYLNALSARSSTILRNSLLPESVADAATGSVYKRPAKWY
jgi:hypothetical protein